MNLFDVCTSELVTVRRSATIIDAAKLMRDKHVGCVVVLGDSLPSRPVGIVSDRDIVIKVVAFAQQQTIATIEKIMSGVVQARKGILSSDAGRSTIFIILACFLVWLYSKKIIDWKLFTAVLGFFIIVDMALVDWRYLNHDNFKTKRTVDVPYQPDDADLAILKDPSLDYRVFNTTIRPDQDGRTSYFHKSLGGYSGVKMKRYDELLGYQIERGNMGVINMLNTKYFIVSQREGNNEVNRAEKNPGALGNAWFVGKYKVVANADSEMVAMDHFEPAELAIVDKRFSSYLPPTLQYDSNSSINMTSYEPNDLKYTSNSKVQELAVFSEIYYKDGWEAYIDDKPSDYIRVNYVLRAMLIPAGQHNIEFKFHPPHYFIGNNISLASSLILYLVCGGFIIMQFRKKPPVPQKITPPQTPKGASK